MKRVGLAVGLASMVVLGGERDARATVVKDGAFGIDVRGANICFISPAALRSPEHCENLPVPDAAAMDDAAGKSKSTFLATGYLRDPDNGLLIGLLQVAHQRGPNLWPDEKAADDFARGFAREQSGAIPGGKATARVSDTRVVLNGETRVVRTTVDLDGLEPGSDYATALEHQEVASVFTREGSYLVVFGGTRANATALRKISTESMPSITLAASARPHEGQDLGYRLGQLSVYVLVGVIGLVVYFVRKRSQAQREAAWRQQLAQGQGQGQRPGQGQPQGGPWQSP